MSQFYPFYYKYFKTGSLILFYVLLILGITILVINSKLYFFSDTLEDRNMNERINTFENYLKTQKALIWTNFSIIIFFFMYLLIISFDFFKSDYGAISERRKGFLTRNIILGIMVIINIGLTIYLNQTLNEMNIFNSKEESKKIFIIVPIISVISISLLMEHFSKTDAALTRIRNILFEQYEHLLNEPKLIPDKIKKLTLTPIKYKN